MLLLENNIFVWRVKYTWLFFVSAIIIPTYLSALVVSAAGADELGDTYYFLNRNYSGNSDNKPPAINLSWGLSARDGQEWTSNDFTFQTNFSIFDIQNEGWYLYLLYFSETLYSSIGYKYSFSNNSGGSGNWQHGVGNSIAEKGNNNLWIMMLEGSCINSNSSGGNCPGTSTSTLSSWGVESLGCPEFCRQPIGVVFSKRDASSEIASVNTDSDIYDLFKSLIQESISHIDQNITSTTTLMNGVYTISGNVEIVGGVTLNIEPGAVLKFDTSTSSSLIVNGILNADGTPEAGQIMMTSLSDDYFGDTNANGTSTVPVAGDWGGIVVNSGGVANLSNTIVRYGGSMGTYGSQVYNNGGTLELIDSRVVYGTINGVRNDSGAANIEGTELAYNTNGLYINGGTVTATTDNVIHDNISYGVFNNTVTTINAQNNFWGHNSGPYHILDNPSGLGNLVSDYVNFNPWIDDLHYVSGSSSVDNREIRWDGTTQYLNQWYAAINTWNALGNINIATDTLSTILDLEVSDLNESDLVWVGLWTHRPIGADSLQLNEYYLQYNTVEEIQNTITHELGHALGLHHSYTGNIMYYRQNSQTSVGGQDESDYYYLWP